MVLSGGYELVATVSVGIAMTDPGKTTDDLLRDADVAMYEAKARGGGGVYRVFDEHRWEPGPPSGSKSRPTCARASSGMSSRCITSRSTPWTGSRSWEPRHWCGGATPSTA